MNNQNDTEPALSVEFFGVRGSLAAPGMNTMHVGGNTSCVQMTYGETTLIFDAGTGIRACGNALMAQEKKKIHLLFSHLHWDHIQGFPFFVPAYVPGVDLQIRGPAPQQELEKSLSRQMRPPNFPVSFNELRANINIEEFLPNQVHELGELEVTSTPLNHPGGVLGYRVEGGGRTIVYTTDHEHSPEADRRLIELARDADILIYDAMYSPEEYRGERGPARKGWGHSTFEEGARIAREAGVAELVLFHHDPSRADSQVHELVERARSLFPRARAAVEGLVMVLGSAGPESRLSGERAA